MERFSEHATWIGRAIQIYRPATEADIDPGRAAAPAPKALPELVEYELLDELGRGGMGVAYLARTRSRPHGGLVALKMIAEHLVSLESIDRFVCEMRSQARLQHPHIVQVLDSGYDDGRPYFTMVYCRGSDLGRVLEEHGPLEPTSAALYVSRIAWAVQYLHEQADQDHPVVHGDLKPKNILLDHHTDSCFRFGRPYLTDFGLVEVLRKVSGEPSQLALVGTIPYMSPEQADGRADVGPACDIWALGVTLFECLTGRLPFRGETRAEIRYQIVHRETPSPRAIRPDVPRDLQRICLKCLKKSPGDRYHTASEVAEDLVCFLKGDPPRHARPEAVPERLVQWTRRAPALAARLAVIVACSAILWGYPLVTGGKFAPLAPDSPVVTTIIPHIGCDPSNPSVLQAAATVLVWANQLTLIAWGLISWVFQRRLDRSGLEGGLQLGWRITDVAVLVLLILLDDAVMSPLTVAFAVLIVASAFWSRADQIIQTTLLSMAGYAVLVVTYALGHPGADRHYRHLHYLVGLALLGLMLTYQANRTQALARISGRS